MFRARMFGLLGSALLMCAIAAPAGAAPEGTLTYGVHVTLAARWLDPAEAEGLITPFMVYYAIHDALVKPMAGRGQYAEPRRVVERVQGRADLRVRPGLRAAGL